VHSCALNGWDNLPEGLGERASARISLGENQPRRDGLGEKASAGRIGDSASVRIGLGERASAGRIRESAEAPWLSFGFDICKV